ncbi:MAG: NUDIX domain-containing protein [Sphingobacteriia bacterium]|nr:NUDIX domain-containing protein [Sphingobacteriia bacterium]
MEENYSRPFTGAFLILEVNNKILLSLRRNTPYGEGYYGLVAGHVEEGERIVEAMIREAKEEIGIDIKEEELEIIHVMSQYSDRENIHFFLRCKNWQGEIVNNEPDKCGELAFFDYDCLPENTLPAIKYVLNQINSKNMFSEFGWLREKIEL